MDISSTEIPNELYTGEREREREREAGIGQPMSATQRRFKRYLSVTESGGTHGQKGMKKILIQYKLCGNKANSAHAALCANAKQ